MRRAILAVTACTVLATLAAAKAPRPVESEWLVTTGAGFKVDGDVPHHEGRLRYLLQFRLRKPVTEILYVTVDFENPQDRNLTLFTEYEILPGTTRFGVVSEMFAHIRIGEKYQVKVWIYADVNRKQLLGTHEQSVLFDMPRALVEQLGIKIL